ncbi:hypothetical protein L7F22_021987 [Adiantum nelumboides]|nr:hypothetical protein [Adiantum nelumboides]
MNAPAAAWQEAGTWRGTTTSGNHSCGWKVAAASNTSGSRLPSTKEPLWMDSSLNPCWVAEELISPGFTAQQQFIGCSADTFSPSLIWACCKTKDLSTGTRLHDLLWKRRLVEKNYSDALITMYAKCGELQKAQVLLDMHNSSSVIPWTALIAGYARQGKGQNALDLFERMQWGGHYS